MIAVRQEATVGLSPSAAFRLFTEGMGSWWPTSEGYAFGGTRTRETTLEPWVGGRLYERFHDGDELQVGRVIACDPPERIVFTWMGPDWPGETEVEVRFRPQADGTHVTLEHRGFEALGEAAEQRAREYGGGWPLVMSHFEAHATAETDEAGDEEDDGSDAA